MAWLFNFVVIQIIKKKNWSELVQLLLEHSVREKVQQ